MKTYALLLTGCFVAGNLAAAGSELTVHLDQVEKPISPELFGIFFEDLNYAADGGLYAELIRNRSFEISALEQPDWNALTFWELVLEDGAIGSLVVDAGRPLHPNNPRYAVLNVGRSGGEVVLRNKGFGGIALEAGETYDVSVHARQLYKGRRWDRDSPQQPPVSLRARLVDSGGAVLAEAPLPLATTEWTRLEATLQPSASVSDAAFELVASEAGGIALDMISLFPRDTFKNRKNGLRRDLAQIIADLKPAFVRFPGGCLVHGNGVSNFYDWKATVGPVEERRGQPNLWGYHQTGGLGYFEYFQFCEDVGAIPVPVVPAAVSCQNSGRTAGTGQACLPLEEMDAYIHDLLDLIEWANGPADSEWGAKRAAAGHPEPFGLKYLGVGNEDKITPEFEERFTMIHRALSEQHPEIVVIGTVGPGPAGEDYEKGWRLARELDLEVVDEHYYEAPSWFFENLDRYAAYDREEAAVYLGEYAAHDRGRRTTLRSSIAEAAYMTALERNGDIVRMASYAPLLGKVGQTQWDPDLIYFDNQQVFPTISYEVQKLFAEARGDQLLASELESAGGSVAGSAVRRSATGECFVKLANWGTDVAKVRLQFAGGEAAPATAVVTTLAGDPDAANVPGATGLVEPSRESRRVADAILELTLPAWSLVIVSLPAD